MSNQTLDTFKELLLEGLCDSDVLPRALEMVNAHCGAETTQLISVSDATFILDSAVEGLVDAIWFNQGQVCCAGSRLLVQEGIAERFYDKLRARMDGLRLGDPLDKCIDVGAVVDPVQLEKPHGAGGLHQELAPFLVRRCVLLQGIAL